MGCYQKKKEERKQHLELMTMQSEQHRLCRAFFLFPAQFSQRFPSKPILFSIDITWKLAFLTCHELAMQKFEMAARK